MRSLFCTNSTIGYGSGGGIVTYHILQALRELPSEVEWFDGRCEGYIENSPYSLEHLIHEKLHGKFDLAVFYGAPFGRIAEKVQPAKIVSDVAPHNIELSREEHHRLGLPFPYPHLNDYNLWRKYMKHVILADLVIVHSNSSGEYLREKLKLSNRIEVLSHGCDLPDAIPDYPNDFVVGHLGVNGPDKGQIYLIRAWNASVVEELRHTPWAQPIKEIREMHLLIAGYNTERLGGLGYISDPSTFYPKLSAYVQPTVTEGFGITVFEAMAHARPVIVTEGAGSSELIEDGKDGFVVPIRSPEAIAEKIIYFYDNPSEIKRIGKNAREKAERYTWTKIRKKYIKLFKEVYLE